MMTMVKGWISSGRGLNSGLDFVRFLTDVYEDLASKALLGFAHMVCSTM